MESREQAARKAKEGGQARDMQGNVIDDVKPTYAVQVHLFFFFITLEPRVE